MAKKKTGRPDARYSDSDAAPRVVSEKRLTFFMPELMHSQIEMISAQCKVENVTARQNGHADEDEPLLPETPSAVMREAVEFLLDTLRNSKDRVRTHEDWESRLDTIRKVLKKGGYVLGSPK